MNSQELVTRAKAKHGPVSLVDPEPPGHDYSSDLYVLGSYQRHLNMVAANLAVEYKHLADQGDAKGTAAARQVIAASQNVEVALTLLKVAEQELA